MTIEELEKEIDKRREQYDLNYSLTQSYIKEYVNTFDNVNILYKKDIERIMVDCINFTKTLK